MAATPVCSRELEELLHVLHDVLTRQQEFHLPWRSVAAELLAEETVSWSGGEGSK